MRRNHFCSSTVTEVFTTIMLLSSRNGLTISVVLSVLLPLSIVGQYPAKIPREFVGLNDLRDKAMEAHETLENLELLPCALEEGFELRFSAFPVPPFIFFTYATFLSEFNDDISEFTWCAWLLPSVEFFEEVSYLAMESSNENVRLDIGGDLHFHVDSDNLYIVDFVADYFDNNWHHLCLTWEAGVSLNVYLDGNLVGTAVSSAGSISPIEYLVVTGFSGRMTDMVMTSAALSSGEIGEIGMTCHNDEGDIIAWRKELIDVFGRVSFCNPTTCPYVGPNPKLCRPRRTSLETLNAQKALIKYTLELEKIAYYDFIPHHIRRTANLRGYFPKTGKSGKRYSNKRYRKN